MNKGSRNQGPVHTSHSIQRIKFGRNSTSESAATFLPHVRLFLSHYPTKMCYTLRQINGDDDDDDDDDATPIQTSHFCRVECNSYIVYVLSMRRLRLAIQEEYLGPPY